MANKITTCLWFEKDTEEAVNFYVSVFKEGGHKVKIGKTTRYDKASAEVSGQREGSVLTIAFELDGQEFLALNGGPLPGFKFNSAISFIINCKNQKEIDHFWAKLNAVPEAGQCGWLSDKYGVAWQVVPEGMDQLVSGPDPVKSGRAMKEMLGMKKLDIAALKKAYEGK